MALEIIKKPTYEELEREIENLEFDKHNLELEVVDVENRQTIHELENERIMEENKDMGDEIDVKKIALTNITKAKDLATAKSLANNALNISGLEIEGIN